MADAEKQSQINLADLDAKRPTRGKDRPEVQRKRSLRSITRTVAEMKTLKQALDQLRNQKPHPATTLAYEEQIGVVEARYVLRQRKNREKDARKVEK